MTHHSQRFHFRAPSSHSPSPSWSLSLFCKIQSFQSVRTRSSLPVSGFELESRKEREWMEIEGWQQQGLLRLCGSSLCGESSVQVVPKALSLLFLTPRFVLGPFLLFPLLGCLGFAEMMLPSGALCFLLTGLWVRWRLVERIGGELGWVARRFAVRNKWISECTGCGWFGSLEKFFITCKITWNNEFKA